MSKYYLITDLLQREKIYDWNYREDFPLNSKLIVFSVVSISYRDVRSTGDFFVCCENAMIIRLPPSQAKKFV